MRIIEPSQNQNSIERKRIESKHVGNNYVEKNFIVVCICDYEHWRKVCRGLVQRSIHPSSVSLLEATATPVLFDEAEAFEQAVASTTFRVPQSLLDHFNKIACHSDNNRWNLMYEALWRYIHGEPHLFAIATDDLVRRLVILEKQIQRDCHKTKAFVRFRKLVTENQEEVFIAWHQPDHNILQLVAPFFARRFKGMVWSIFTPQQSAHWDGEELVFGEGISKNPIEDDSVESLWKVYYGSTFNPARIKINAMKREMPVRFWKTLPEAELIEDLLADAPDRVQKMIAQSEGLATTAKDYLPISITLDSLRSASATCTACELCRYATQTVFGEGPHDAKLVLIGEQPGDEEDLAGRPFVGPAGRLLMEILESLEINRNAIYLTNAVKHFGFEPQDKQRLHKKPSTRQTSACRPWLEAELELLKPKIVVCLGNTALQTVMGRHLKLTEIRGIAMDHDLGFQVIATWHPSFLLRSPVDMKELRQEELRKDLANAIELSEKS